MRTKEKCPHRDMPGFKNAIKSDVVDNWYVLTQHGTPGSRPYYVLECVEHDYSFDVGIGSQAVNTLKVMHSYCPECLRERRKKMRKESAARLLEQMGDK